MKGSLRNKIKHAVYFLIIHVENTFNFRFDEVENQAIMYFIVNKGENLYINDESFMSYFLLRFLVSNMN